MKGPDGTPKKFMALKIKQLVAHFPTDCLLTRTLIDIVNKGTLEKKIFPSCKIEAKMKKKIRKFTSVKVLKGRKKCLILCLILIH